MSQVYAARRTRLRERCNAGGSAAALVSRPANVRYLAGAAPRGAVLLLGKTEDLLICSTPPDDRPADGRPDDALPVRTLPGPGGAAAVAAAGPAAAQGAASPATADHHLPLVRHRATPPVAPPL
ncbi:aminopeptidase P family N-terminal domain-containing protein, partial [Streptomyces vinaceusdrappus]